MSRQRVFHAVSRVYQQTHPFTWEQLKRLDEAIDIGGWQVYDTDQCVFLDKSKPVPEDVWNITTLPNRTVRQPEAVLKETFTDLKEVMGTLLEEEKLRPDQYKFIGETIDLHPWWVEEIHQFYLKGGKRLQLDSLPTIRSPYEALPIHSILRMIRDGINQDRSERM